jgi:ABC-type multidrug transport system fused ATPase/permease subunit
MLLKLLKDLWKSKKFISWWLFITFIFCILIIACQEFARQVTLDNVRAYDFKIVKSAITGDKKNIKENFLLISNELTAREFRSVLFPLAIINNNTCQGNGSTDSNNKICQYFPTLKEWKLNAKNEEFNSYFKITYKEYKDTSFMFDQVSEDWILVGEAGNYLRLFGNESGQIFEFILNQLPKKLSSINAIFGMWYKSKWSLFLISFLSFIALIFSVAKIRSSEYKNLKELNNAKKAVADVEIQCSDLQDKIDNYKTQLADKNILIDSLESQITLGQTNAQEQNQQNKEMFGLYENEIKQLEKSKKELENEREMLLDKVVIASKNIGIEESQKELKNTQQRYNNLTRLWRSNTKWQDRHLIEEQVGIQHRVPFTLSAAFIAFESWVDDYWNDLQSQTSSEVSISLKDKIDIIANREPQRRSSLHQIRIARNAWFHSGKSPEKGIIKELLLIVANEEPRI